MKHRLLIFIKNLISHKTFIDWFLQLVFSLGPLIILFPNLLYYKHLHLYVLKYIVYSRDLSTQILQIDLLLHDFMI